MNYLAHISEDKTREQSVLSHLKGAAELAGGFASEFGCEDWGYYVGMLHDIGKYSEAFQRRLRGSAVRVDHSTAGAKLSYERTGEGPKTLRLAYAIASYCIAGHHAGLPDRGGSSDTAERKTFSGRMKKKLEDYSAYESEVKLPLIRTEVNLSEGSKTPGFEVNFITRFLYSCLVDADYLDTESFMRGEKPRGRGQGESLKELKERLDHYIEPWLRDDPKSEINRRRTEILKSCLLAGEGEKGLYRLSVPTGGGKTIASLAFALRHALCHGMKRIIYVIPYTSIIEQNAAVFKEILGEQNVLEHHSNVDYEDDEELCPMQLAAENWDMPLIVTTNVQFFESLFSNRPSKCRKIHNIANSVLIFDEAQMLPKDYLQPCISSIEELIRRYHCSAVLCTATQPDIDPFLQSAGEVRELCPDMAEQFSFFRRCEIRFLGKLEQETLLERLSGETQALCILNTRREVQEIYELLRKDGGEDGLYHLSTLMIPKHRRKVLGDIRERLKKGDGKRCIVISTSLVEAGVDLDFASVYREIAGLDSIIQAVGRCNREGRRKREESICHVFSLEDSKSVPLSQKQRIEIGSWLLEKGRDPADPDTIREYFWMLYGKPGRKAIPGTERSDRKAVLGMQETDKKAILKKIEENPFSFPTQAEDLRLIEQNGETIFVPWDEEGRELLFQIEREGMSRKRARAMQQYSVNLYENLFRQLFDAGKFRALESGAKGNLYVLREKEDYSEEKGILLEAELGEGSEMSVGVKVKIWGDYALFSRPELRVERYSYDVITPSAARGILEAIYWHPGLRWQIDRIHVLKPICFTSIRRNEVESKILCGKLLTAYNGGKGEGLFLNTKADIVQRSSIILKDVAYGIEAHFEMTEKASPGDNPGKFKDIMSRRLRKGECYHQPYLGCREFPAFFCPWDEGEEHRGGESRDFGLMLYDMDYSNPEDIRPTFFRAKMENGVIDLRNCEVLR